MLAAWAPFSRVKARASPYDWCTCPIPKELLDVLRWDVDTQLRPGPQQESDLLFPSEIGGFRSR